ncbi:MAG: hypothetical protein ACR2MY_14280 [Candidatus Dormibacteria bacterium]
MTPAEKPIPHIPLEGEDISTTHWEDARHWLSVYADLMSFKRRLLDRVHLELQHLNPAVQRAATLDLQIIENQMEGYQLRLDLWYQVPAGAHAATCGSAPVGRSGSGTARRAARRI